MPAPIVRVQILLPQSQLDALQIEGKRTGNRRSALIRTAIDRYLNSDNPKNKKAQEVSK